MSRLREADDWQDTDQSPQEGRIKALGSSHQSCWRVLPKLSQDPMRYDSGHPKRSEDAPEMTKCGAHLWALSIIETG